MTFKIRQIGISKYGPLEDCKIDLNPNFQCIFGPNESGKTLIIDAVLKMALPSKLHTYLAEDLQRVDGKAHGWITIDVDGKKHEISDSKKANEILPIDLENLRDLLVVRNSDLYNFNEAGCLSRATDLMMGLRTEEIERIQEALKERGQLTPTNLDISTAGGPESAGNQISLARELRSDIGKYLAEVGNTEVSEAESKIIRLTTELEASKHIEAELIEARNLAEFRKLKASLERGRNALGQLVESQEDVVQAGISEISTYRDFDQDYNSLEQKQQKVGRWIILSLTGSVLLGILSQLLNSIIVGVTQSLVMLGIFIGMLVYWRSISKDLYTIRESRKSIIYIARDLGSNTVEVEEAIEAIRKKSKEIEEWKDSLTESVGSIKSLLDLKSGTKEEALALAEQAVANRKPDINEDIDRKYDDNKYKEVKESIEEKRERIEKLRENLRNHQSSLGNFKTRFGKLHFQQYLGRPADYSPDSIDSLPKVQVELKHFISSIEETATQCAIAVKLFDELAEEEQNKISELLSKNSRASEIFSNITHRRYSEITYLSEKKAIRVRRQDGSEMRILNLSKGTKDQMYLSVRLALAEQILRGKPGFFVLDDPFIASDLERRAIQIEMLKKMTDEGWQVLYFTANENLANELKSKFKTNYVTLPPLK